MLFDIHCKVSYHFTTKPILYSPEEETNREYGTRLDIDIEL
jgi:hypothetical protein